MKRFLILFFLLSAFCLLMLSCASNWTKNNGNFAQDDDIKTMFETHEYVPDYNYFYTRYANDPEAIVGIKKDYEIVKANTTSDGDFSMVWAGYDYSTSGVQEIWGPDNQLYGFIIYQQTVVDSVNVKLVDENTMQLS